MVGPPQKSIEEVFRSSKEEPWIDKVCFVSGEELEAHRQTAYDEFLKENPIPVYLSIDKDILREEDASVNWDQGKTSLEELLALVKSCFEKTNHCRCRYLWRKCEKRGKLGSFGS